MKVTIKAQVIGARYYDITDEKTGEINRYTSIFTIQKQEEKPDRAGYEGSKIKCNNSALVAEIAAMKLPSEVTLECDMEMNAKGEPRLKANRIVKDEALRKAA